MTSSHQRVSHLKFPSIRNVAEFIVENIQKVQKNLSFQLPLIRNTTTFYKLR